MIRGIVFVCRNIGQLLNKNVVTDFSRRNADLHLCFVDNNSKDITSDILQELREECPNIVIVSIKRQLSAYSAERAGARYMFSTFKLKQLATVDLNTALNHFKPIDVIFAEIEKYHLVIFNDYFNGKVSKTTRNELVNKTFSILRYLIDLKQNKTPNKFENNGSISYKI